VTPNSLCFTARLGLYSGLALVAFLMVGPFQGLERSFALGDKQAHFMAFYGLASLCFLAFPKTRRAEMALVLVTIGALLEVAQGFTGRDMDVFDVIADSCGVYAVVIPTWVEQLRALARDRGDEPLAKAWLAYDRRRPSSASASFNETTPA
jgi:VanZ family protein